MEEIERGKNVRVKGGRGYRVWDVCGVFIEMIGGDVDIDIESKGKCDEVVFGGYVIRGMECVRRGRGYGVDCRGEDWRVCCEWSGEVILGGGKMVKERFDWIGNGMVC
ncbi:hypothetical protein ACRFB9_28160 [Klebsiella pneumoniae]